MESGLVLIKLSYYGETHRLKIDLSTFTYDVLLSHVQQQFPDLPLQWTVVYTDNEQELITVSSAMEFMEACRVFLRLKKKTMHFHVVSKMTIKDHIAPIVNAVEGFSHLVMRVAIETKDNIQHGPYSEAFALSAIRTRELLERVHMELRRRVADVHLLLTEEVEDSTVYQGMEQGENTMAECETTDVQNQETALDCDQESPFEDIATESQRPLATIVADTAANRDSVDEIRSCPSDADTDSTSSEDVDQDWDVVVPSVPHEDAPEEGGVEADVVEEWTDEIAMIRDILPHVEPSICCDLLNKYDGDIEAVLIELTDI